MVVNETSKVFGFSSSFVTFAFVVLVFSSSVLDPFGFGTFVDLVFSSSVLDPFGFVTFVDFVFSSSVLDPFGFVIFIDLIVSFLVLDPFVSSVVILLETVVSLPLLQRSFWSKDYSIISEIE